MKQTVLLVDDNIDIRRMLRFALTSAFDVWEASDTDKAWEIICNQAPSATIIDVMLPGSMNGLELCSRIKADPRFRGIYVALASACGQPADQAYGLAVGANAYHVKPFSPIALNLDLCLALGQKKFLTESEGHPIESA